MIHDAAPNISYNPPMYVDMQLCRPIDTSTNTKD